MMMKAIWRQEKGFTLIELLIVVAIIGILAGIAVPRINLSLTKAKDATCKANINAIQSAIELYYFENDDYPDSLDDLDFREDPVCPFGDAYVIDRNSGEVKPHDHSEE